jgi:hypothetical protein
MIKNKYMIQASKIIDIGLYTTGLIRVGIGVVFAISI